MPCCDDPKLVHACNVSLYQDVERVSLDGKELILSDQLRFDELDPYDERWFCATCGHYFEDQKDAIA